MKIINFIRDIIYDLYQYIVILAIMGIVSFVLYTTIVSMYETDYNHLVSTKNKEAMITETKEKESNNFELFFPENSSILDISKILVDSGVITDQEKFVNFLQENQLENSLQSGSYNFRKNMTYEEIIKIFENNEDELTEE